MIREDIELRKLKSHVNYVLRKDFYKKTMHCDLLNGNRFIKTNKNKKHRKLYALNI